MNRAGLGFKKRKPVGIGSLGTEVSHWSPGAKHSCLALYVNFRMGKLTLNC